MYTSNCNVTNENVIHLLECALAFQVNSLVHNLCDYLVRVLDKCFSINEVIRIYSMSTQYKHIELQAECIGVIKRSATVVLHTSEWKRLEKKKPCLVIKAFYSDPIRDLAWTFFFNHYVLSFTISFFLVTILHKKLI